MGSSYGKGLAGTGGTFDQLTTVAPQLRRSCGAAAAAAAAAVTAKSRPDPMRQLFYLVALPPRYRP